MKFLIAVLFLGIFSESGADHESQRGKNITAEERPQCFCGIRNEASEPISTRIVGGTEAKKHEFPWKVALFETVWTRVFYFFGTFKSPSYTFICTGSLISNNWVLTAAHCVISTKTPSDLTLSFGDHDLRTSNETREQLRSASKIHVHPKYKDKTSENDIALIYFTRAVEFSRAIAPICLPVRQRNVTFGCGKAIASGWGVTHEDKNDAGQELREVELDLVPNHTCDQQYDITEDMLCTHTPGKDTCQGDSGGTLDKLYEGTKSYCAIGITSFGEGCGRPNKSGVYTRVTSYLDWIQKTTGVTFCSRC